MDSNLKKPKKGAGSRLREFYNQNIRKQPMSPELKEVLKKKEAPAVDDLKKISAKVQRDGNISG